LERTVPEIKQSGAGMMDSGGCLVSCPQMEEKRGEGKGKKFCKLYIINGPK
jgi:hypothetical protein